MQNLDFEKELLEKIQADKKYFDELYKYFLNDLYRFSYSLVQNQSDAEDITSRTFLEFYKKVNVFKWTGISLKSWLFRTARNFAYEKFREPVNESYNDEFNETESDEISFVDQIMNMELVEQVKKEIENLNSVEREIINLRIWEGMKFDQIANIQNTTVNTAIQRFKRSIAKLKKNLNNKGIRSLLALPLLFTAVKQAGTAHAYNAPMALVESKFINGTLVKNKLIMEQTTNKLAGLLNLKLLIGFVITTMTVAIIGGISLYNSNKNIPNENTELDNMITLTPTITPIISPEISAVPTTFPTQTNLPILKKSLSQIARDSCRKITKNESPKIDIVNFPFYFNQTEYPFKSNSFYCINSNSTDFSDVYFISSDNKEFISDEKSIELGHDGEPFIGTFGAVLKQGADFEISIFAQPIGTSGSSTVEYTSVVLRAVKILAFKNGEKIYINTDFKLTEFGDKKYEDIFNKYARCSGLGCTYDYPSINKDIAQRFLANQQNAEKVNYEDAHKFLSAISIKTN
jgi:RNA polymerase sigma-70 factor (ECF subfamily)